MVDIEEIARTVETKPRRIVIPLQTAPDSCRPLYLYDQGGSSDTFVVQPGRILFGQTPLRFELLCRFEMQVPHARQS